MFKIKNSFKTFSELTHYQKLCTSCVKNSVDPLVKTVSSDRWKYKLDQNVEKDLENETYKPRHHPGIIKHKSLSIPEPIVKAINNTLEDQKHPKAQLIRSSEKFVRQLHERKAPMENEELKEKVQVIKEKVMNKVQKKKPDLIDDKHFIKNEMNILLGKLVYNWSPTKYDYQKCLLYLIGRSAAEYAVLYQILSEISSRDSSFKPRSLFDFGSGVGTVTWAANSLWPGSFYEYFNVDASSEMNELSEHILKKTKAHNKSVYYRQFLPATPIPFDLVVSAYSLMELPSLKNRLQTIQTLWNKTTKYMIIVEHGTLAGYQIINEIRDFILGLKDDSHVFSPCPHDNTCPRYMLNDGTPCNFELSYYNMPLGDVSKLNKERYSYIILKKGPRDENEPKWPRLVRPTLLRHKHCICTLCTADGNIEQSFFTASKYGRLAYRCAKTSNWGDRLPMDVKEEFKNKQEEEVDQILN